MTRSPFHPFVGGISCLLLFRAFCLVDGVQSKMLKEEPKNVTMLSPEKEEKLLAELRPQHAKAMVVTALNTGMGKREIFDLLKENVDFKSRMIHVTRTKNWEIRNIPMNELLTRTLKEVIESSPDDNPYVFPNPKTGKPFTSIKTTFTKAVKSPWLIRDQ